MIPDFIIFAYDRGLFFYYSLFLLPITPILTLISIFLFLKNIRIALITLFATFFLVLFLFLEVIKEPTGYEQNKKYSIEELYSEGLISKKAFDYFYPKVMKERLEAEKEAKEEEAKAKEEEEKQRIKKIEKQKIREERIKEIEEVEKEFKSQNHL